MSDLISRQAAISHVDDVPYIKDHPNVGLLWKAWIESLPSAQPEIKPIGYRDCANAMLKMWMDNVVTDGEYNRIMDKLNAHWGKKDG